MNIYGFLFVILLDILVPVIGNFAGIPIITYINYLIWFNILFLLTTFSPTEVINYKEILNKN